MADYVCHVDDAIEVNEAIIPRSQYAEYSLSAGDVVEVVVAIGGG